MLLLWRSVAFKIYFKASTANYQFLEHLKMMSEPLSPHKKKKAFESECQYRDLNMFPQTEES